MSTPPAFFIFKDKTVNEGIQLNEEMKISIIEYEKQIPYGYIQIPLWNFARHKKKSVLKNFSVNIYDNFTYEKKEEIELCLKSNEIKTIKDFNLFW